MIQNSISSFRHPLFRVGSTLLILAGLSSLVLRAWGHHFAQWISNYIADPLLRVGDGKFTDVPGFLLHRMVESCWLLAVIGGLLLVNGWLLARQTRSSSTWNWVLPATVIFVSCNLFVAAASHCAVFWLAMWQGEPTHGLVQFRLKEILAAEQPSPRQAVLVGNSQMRAQVDEKILNELLGDRIWTTELHFPGTQPFDLLLIESTLRDLHPDLVILYVSELTLFDQVSGGRFAYFMDWQGYRTFRELHGPDLGVPSAKTRFALTGALFPLFRYRDVFVQRAFGTAATASQRRHDNSLEKDLNARARNWKHRFSTSDGSHFHRDSLARFVTACGLGGTDVLLLAGQVNPVLQKYLPEEMSLLLHTYLRDLATENPHVHLLQGAPWMVHGVEDYADLTHVIPTVQRSFTDELAAWLDANQPWE